MSTRFSKLTLRDLFWLMLLAAVAIGWWVERNRAWKQIAEYRAQFSWLSIPAQTSGAEAHRWRLFMEFRGLSEQELLARLAKETPASPYHASDEYCCCLLEMAGRRMKTELQSAYDKLKQTTPQPPHSELADAYLLTALRRAEGKTDPLQVELAVETVTTADQNPPRQTPQIKVSLRNIDTVPINVTHGGDYRSGRQTRWRVELTNEAGVRVPDSNYPTSGIGGGMSSFGPLSPGQVLDSFQPLDARSYVKSPPSGRYQLQVIYAEREIAGEPGVAGLIVWKAEPLTVQVENDTSTHEQRFSAVPLLSILGVGGVVFCLAELRRRRLSPANAPSARGWWNWRDLLALVCIVGLTIGWIAETRSLYATIDGMRPDRDASWSMTVVDP